MEIRKEKESRHLKVFTPNEGEMALEVLPSNFTHCFWLVKYDENQERISSPIPESDKINNKNNKIIRMARSLGRILKKN